MSSSGAARRKLERGLTLWGGGVNIRTGTASNEEAPAFPLSFLPIPFYLSLKTYRAMSCQCLPPADIPAFIAQIPKLLYCHETIYPGTENVEKCGENLILNNFDPQLSKQFIEEVCNWAGPTGKRVWSKVDAPQKNNPQKIGNALQKGYVNGFNGNVTNVAQGVNNISKLYGLGQSFASKMLRFLCPQDAVILDSIIRKKCNYKANMSYYIVFLRFCDNLLNQAKNRYPNLRICDIEAALFIYIKRN